MRIRLLGQRSALGAGVHFSNFADQLKALRGLGTIVDEVDATKVPALEEALRQSRPDDINIWFLRNPGVSLIKGTRVLWAIFESDRLPADYVAYYRNNADVVWVPSEWGRSVLIKEGIDPAIIDVIPEGVNPSDYHPFLRPQYTEAPKPFRFLSVGKYEERKAYGILLEAFAESFGANADVELIIKADYFLRHSQKKAELERLVDSMGLKNVQLLWGDFTADMMLGLYNHANAFVFPSRAEGWGLPLIEAIASGLPAITTFYSGHTEYLRHIESLILKIDHDLVPIADPEFLQYWPTLADTGARWAEPSVLSLASCMRRVIQDYPSWQTLAERASDAIRVGFSWAQSAEYSIRCLLARGALKVSIQ